MPLLDRHLAFLEALRAAGLPVSLAEDLDAVAALDLVGWADRSRVHDVYAATVVKRTSWLPTFEEIFELYFPRTVGSGASHSPNPALDEAESRLVPGRVAGSDGRPQVEEVRDGVVEALSTGETERARQAAVQTMGALGSMPGRGPGMSSWSAYSALRRINPGEIERRLVAALTEGGWPDGQAATVASRRVREFQVMVESDARRRIAEEKGPEHLASVTVRPTIEKLNFLHARKADIEELRRQLYPLARKLATKMNKRHLGRGRGPLDVRRTMRESMSYGGVPVVTHHRPKRPHRNDLVVLCDVSGSVSHFATFTLLLVIALREQFSNVRAFMFVDDVVEVTDQMPPGADLVDTMSALTRAATHAATMGRTNYGQAFTKFVEKYPDAVGSKTAFLVLGDARSNYAELHLPVLREIVGRARYAWWLNPEAERQWDVGDSAASPYASVMPMVECRNLEQLSAFVERLG